MNNQLGYYFSENNNSDEILHSRSINAKGSDNVKFPINVFTEFGNLKAVIVGYMDITSMMPDDCKSFNGNKLHIGPYDPEIIRKNHEIQNSLVEKLEERGINVVRPSEYDFSKRFNIQGYETNGFHAFNPRDIILYYHDSIYEFPTFHVSRQTEFECFNNINSQLRIMGGKWFKSYKGLSSNYEELRANQGYSGQDKIDPDIPMFDAANLIRLGLDILFLISYSANEQGYKLFRNFMEERYGKKVRVHPMRNIHNSVHVDTTISILGFNDHLQKYIAVVNKKYVKPINVPAIFRGKNWVILECPKLEHLKALPGYEICSPEELGMNFFTINSKLVVVEERQKLFINMLNFYGVETIAHPNPYGRESAGAFHCMTNDYCREEEKDYKKVLESNDINILSAEDLAGLFDSELLEFLSKQGDLDDWVDICNKNNIFPSYLSDHLSEEESKEMRERHELDKKTY